MIRQLYIVIFLIVSIHSFAQIIKINIVSESKIQFEDTIKFDFQNNYFRPSIIDTLSDLRIGYCDDFYMGIGNRVKFNKQLKDLRLDIIGGKAYYYGAKNEFLLVPDSSIMILKHKNKRIIHNMPIKG